MYCRKQNTKDYESGLANCHVRTQISMGFIAVGINLDLGMAKFLSAQMLDDDIDGFEFGPTFNVLFRPTTEDGESLLKRRVD